MYLIGSRGLSAVLIDNPVKADADWDIVFEENESRELPFKYDDCSDLNTLEVCKKFDIGHSITLKNIKFNLIYPIGHALLKRSHLHRPEKFAKNIVDYHKLKSKWLDQLDTYPSDYLELLSERIKLTKEKYGDRTPSLNKTTDKFFDDFITKYYNHDDLHNIVAYYDKPLFEKLKTNKNKVWCSKELWNKLSHQDKIKCVQEECFVIALERYIIPDIENNKKHPPTKFAFYWALERVCTTLTSGWFRDFAIDYWPEITVYNKDFLGLFNNALSNRKIKRIN